MNHKTKLLLSITLTTHFLLLTTNATSAQVDLGNAFRLNTTDSVQSVFPNPGSLLSAILPNIYIFAGVILSILIVFGGFKVITSANNPEETAKGTQAITGAIIGFLVLFSSFWIIQIIEILTGTNILNANIPGLT